MYSLRLSLANGNLNDRSLALVLPRLRFYSFLLLYDLINQITGLSVRQTGLEVTYSNRNESRSQVYHKSMVRIVVVEDGLRTLGESLESMDLETLICVPYFQFCNKNKLHVFIVSTSLAVRKQTLLLHTLWELHQWYALLHGSGL
ncbi:hypothetical protein Tco_1447805 [Tanacetum coccineum]|uniref:Uncharacterized protein n=1 Tax=Tanacetum coccineum TaxID=301880 RepID=A0ABQ4Z9L3_9ASTR